MIATGTQVLNNSAIILRKFRSDDLFALQQLCADKDVSAHWAGGASEKSYQLLSKHVTDPSVSLFTLIYKPTMEFAGIAGFIPSQSEYPEIHVAITPKYRKSGLARNAFELCLNFANDVLNEQQVACHVLSDNRKAKGVLRKIGFRFKKTTFRNGKSWDQFVFNQ